VTNRTDNRYSWKVKRLGRGFEKREANLLRFVVHVGDKEGDGTLIALREKSHKKAVDGRKEKSEFHLTKPRES